MTPVRSDSGESNLPGSSYVPGSPSPEPDRNMLFDEPDHIGMTPIPEYEYVIITSKLAEWPRLKKGTYRKVEV